MTNKICVVCHKEIDCLEKEFEVSRDTYVHLGCFAEYERKDREATKKFFERRRRLREG